MQIEHGSPPERRQSDQPFFGPGAAVFAILFGIAVIWKLLGFNYQGYVEARDACRANPGFQTGQSTR